MVGELRPLLARGQLLFVSFCVVPMTEGVYTVFLLQSKGNGDSKLPLKERLSERMVCARCYVL